MATLTITGLARQHVDILAKWFAEMGDDALNDYFDLWGICARPTLGTIPGSNPPAISTTDERTGNMVIHMTYSSGLIVDDNLSTGGS